MGRSANVVVDTVRIGEDWLFVVTGGKAHIGATATVGEGKYGAIRELTELPGHKEGELALALAERAAERLQAIVSVVAGIHIPHATKEEILQAVEDAYTAFEQKLSEVEA